MNELNWFWILMLGAVLLMCLLSHAGAQTPTRVYCAFSETVKPATVGTHYVLLSNSWRTAKLWLRKATDTTYYADIPSALMESATAEFTIPAGNWVDVAGNGNLEASLSWSSADVTPPTGTLRFEFAIPAGSTSLGLEWR